MQTRIATNPRRANNKGLTRRMRRATPAQAMRTARSSTPRSTCAALPQAMASLATSGATGGMALESAGVAKKMRSGTSALETKTHIDNSAESNVCLLDYTGCLGFRAANRSVFDRLLTRALARNSQGSFARAHGKCMLADGSFLPVGIEPLQHGVPGMLQGPPRCRRRHARGPAAREAPCRAGLSACLLRKTVRALVACLMSTGNHCADTIYTGSAPIHSRLANLQQVPCGATSVKARGWPVTCPALQTKFARLPDIDCTEQVMPRECETRVKMRIQGEV